MKRLLQIAVLFSFISIASCAHETYVVRERPAEVVYVRPAPPGPEHIWISGDWVWASGGYRWHEGHYERRRPGVAWHDGHWQNTGHGWKWASGHWG